VFPVAWTLDTMGFFTRSVSDAALMLGTLVGRDEDDPSSIDAPGADYVRAANHAETPPRIGVLGGLFAERANGEVSTHAGSVAERLASAGAVVEAAATSADFEGLLGAHRITMDVEGARVHRADLAARPGDYGPKLTAMINDGLAYPAVDYVGAQETRRSFRAEMERLAARYDVILTPSTPAPPPRGLKTTGDPVFQTPWTTCGFPSISIPSGLSESGLPLGIQLAASPLGEERLLAAAAWCESVLDVELRPPL